MGAAELAIAELILEHQIRMLRVSAGYEREALLILLQMERELSEKLIGSRPLTNWSRDRLTNLLNETRSRIAEYYIEIRKSTSLGAIAKTEATFVASRMQSVIGTALTVAVPTNAVLNTLVGDLLIQGAPSAEWWRRQGQDTAFRFANAVRQGVAQGETNAQIVQRVRGTSTQPGIMEVSKRNAEALVRSSVQTAANVSRLATYRENDDVILGVRQLSTLDSRTTDICIAYSGAQWDLDGNPIRGTKLPFNGGPPRHWNCRSVLVPIVKPIPGMPEFLGGSRASEDGPVAADISFSDWLGGKSKAYQDDLLGKGKAELWRKGKITLPQLLDQRGRPLTLEQLIDKYGNPV